MDQEEGLERTESVPANAIDLLDDTKGREPFLEVGMGDERVRQASDVDPLDGRLL
jgi:hypothetical protein